MRLVLQREAAFKKVFKSLVDCELFASELKPRFWAASSSFAGAEISPYCIWRPKNKDSIHAIIATHMRALTVNTRRG